MNHLTPEEIRIFDTLKLDEQAAERSLQIAISYTNNLLADCARQRERLIRRIAARLELQEDDYRIVIDEPYVVIRRAATGVEDE